MDAAERDALIASIMGTVSDYRLDQIPPLNAGRVLAWLNQFDAADRPAILRETDRLLRANYVPRAKAKLFIEAVSTATALVGSDAKSFWQSVGFLRIQQTGGSQLDMLALLEEVLQQKFNVSTASAVSTNNTYVYLDDVLFSGTRIKHDLLGWFDQNNIQNATVWVITLASYRGGEWNAESGLRQVQRERSSQVNFRTANYFENRKSRARNSEVLWLASLPESDPYVEQWKATLTRNDFFVARPPGGRGSQDLFSTEESRHTVEQAFFKKGAYICSLSGTPDTNMRPLGFSILETPGFGATVVTYRNCPNNAPLVLWWGDPTASGPISQWTPLLPRHFGAGASHGF